MRKPSTKRVAIVVQPTRTYCRRVARGIAEVGSEAGWEWLLVPTEGASALTGTAAVALDGIIGYVADAAWPEELLESDVPVVDISTAGAASSAASHAVRVASDEVAVGRVVAAYLLSLGLPHFGFFGRRGREDSRLRQRGFTGTITIGRLRLPVASLAGPRPGTPRTGGPQRRTRGVDHVAAQAGGRACQQRPAGASVAPRLPLAWHSVARGRRGRRRG